MGQSQKNWHSLNREETLSKLESDPGGLSVQEAQKRITVYGPNELKKQKGKSPLKLLLEQFTDVLMIILLIAIALSFVVGEPTDAAIILAIVIASAVLGFTQEYRSEKAVDALKKMTAPNANVLRGGRELKVPADQLVPGDIILLYTGDKVPADARLLEAFVLKINEASLTGESTPAGKSSETIPERTSLNDKRNMVFMGTNITYGRGKAVVTETGMETEFGKIAKLVQATPTEQTPLESRLSGVGKWIGIICITVALSVGAVGVIVEHRPIVDMILWAVSLAVAAVPEALPAIVTGALAIGMYRMAKVSTIVKRLPAVETLGSTSVICSDKTGTMTKGEMTVQQIYVNHQTLKLTGIGYTPIGEFQRENETFRPDEHLEALLKTAILCNDSNIEKDEKTGTWIVKGDPTEGALVVAARKADIIKEQLESQEYRIAEIPFSSERKRMTTIHETKGKKFAYMKGAPEVVLERCTKIFLNGEIQPLTNETIVENVEVMEAMAFQALRNLGFAFRDLSSLTGEFDEGIEHDFVFLGLAGMIDPARPEVRDAIATCKNAGIRVVMITGDHKLTATAIGRDLCLLDEKEDNLVLTGKELEDMTDEQLEDVVEKVAVYARVSPEHKMRIVKAWKSKGEVVAMTGDGVNDAPALKMSDIGIAMGITGTEVTKDAADMVLADDNFASIVKAVKEGREIYDNIKKYLTYLLQCNIMEILVMFFAVVSIPYLARAFTANPDIALVSSAGIALTAVQILWVNLVTDGLPAIALGVDIGDPDLMQRQPRKPKESLFSRDVKVYLSTMPIFMAVLLLTAFFARMPWESTSNLIDARTTLFTAMVMIELAVAISCRSLKFPILKVGLFKNKFLWIALVSSFALQLFVLYAPGVQGLFNVQTPSAMDWGVAVLFAFVVFLTLEISKYVNSRRNSPQSFKTKSAPIKV